MRILTVRQPWAHAIIHRGKDVENRVRNIAGSYLGPVAIHAGQTLDLVNPSDRMLAEYAMLPAEGRETGAILGVVDLVDVHEQTHEGRDCACSGWAETGAWHLCLRNPRPLAQPIPYRGALGLRTLDDAATAAVWAAIA